MVDVGVGLTPGSDWWVVTIYTPQNPDAGQAAGNFWSWVTDAPSGGTLWIATLRSGSPASDWRNVSWTGERLTRARTAQNMTLTCLGSTLGAK